MTNTKRVFQVPHGSLSATGRINFETQTAASAPTTASINTVNTPNFIAWLMNEDMLTDEFILLATKMANQLTGRVAWYLDRHVQNMARNTDLDEDIHPTSLDKRNAQDEATRGKELSDHLTDISGHEVQMTPYQIAEISDGLRILLWEKVNEKCDGALGNGYEYLNFGEFAVNGFTSLESTCRRNIDYAENINGNVNKNIQDRRFGSSAAAAQARAEANAKAVAGKMRDRLNAVMAESNSLDYLADEDEWMRLPQRDRDVMVQRIMSGIEIALDPDNPKGLRAKADAAFNEKSRVKFGNDITTHELAKLRLNEWIEANGVAGEDSLEQAKQLQAELKRRMEIAEAAKKTAETKSTESGIAGLTDDIPS